MKHLLIQHPFSQKDLELLQVNLRDEYIIQIEQDLSKLSSKQLAQIQVLIAASLEKQLIAHLPRLELVISPIAGVEKLPLEELSERKILVANNHSNAWAVAEFGVSLLMSTFKRVSYFDRYCRNYQTLQLRQADKPSASSRILKDLQIGFIGFGHIGQRMAQFLQPYQPQFVVYTPSGKITPRYDSPTLPPVQVSSLDKLLGTCEIVCITLPLTPLTNNLIDAQKLSLMKPGAVLINISRSEIVDLKALIHALKNNQIKGAGVDVWAKDIVADEKKSKTITDLPSLVISPYRSARVDDLDIVQSITTDLVEYAQKGMVIHQVIAQRGY